MHNIHIFILRENDDAAATVVANGIAFKIFMSKSESKMTNIGRNGRNIPIFEYVDDRVVSG